MAMITASIDSCPPAQPGAPGCGRTPPRAGPVLAAVLAWCGATLIAADSDPPAASPVTDPAAVVATDASTTDDARQALVAVIGKDGKPMRSAYLREATSFDAQSMYRRLGPDYAFFHKKDAKPEKFPEVWLRPDIAAHKNPTGYESPYQIGKWITEAGGFSSSVSQLFYVPEGKGDHGVDRVYVGGNANGCYWQKPYLWPPGGSHPEPAVTQAGYNAMAGGFLGGPVAQARAYGVWTNDSLMVFQSGVLAIAGSNTSQDRYQQFQFQFPPHKVPTAICLTSQNEFALVTIWDIKELKGQVAVLALESGYAAGDGLMALYSWHESYPGLCNVGGFRFAKLLGYLDLPGIYAPTAISAWSNARWWGEHISTKEGLATQAARDKWRAGLEGKGPLEYQGGCTTGYAVVASRSENRIAFIDLRPLFMLMAKMYFTSEENFTKTKDQGQGAKQWPYTFEAAPECRPKVSPAMVSKQPTAVACSPFGSSGSWFGHQNGRGCRAYVAGMAGTLSVYATDSLADDQTASQNVPIALLGSVPVGRNPCSIAYDRTQFSAHKNALWIVSRGDRKLQHLIFGAEAPEIDLTISDSRLLDPVEADVTDNHSSGGKILMVCDYAGRCLTGYRYEKVTLTTKEEVFMGPAGKDPFECTGSLMVNGYPFSVCASNVN
jgi:hypothetical protein